MAHTNITEFVLPQDKDNNPPLLWLFMWIAGYYSQIHPALQQIPAHSTRELCLWLVSSR